MESFTIFFVNALGDVKTRTGYKTIREAELAAYELKASGEAREIEVVRNFC